MSGDENSKDEIEVTPEMIEAGSREFRVWEPNYDFDGREAAKRAFRAMWLARPRS